jgi:hypothetical protein
MRNTRWILTAAAVVVLLVAWRLLHSPTTADRGVASKGTDPGHMPAPTYRSSHTVEGTVLNVAGKPISGTIVSAFLASDEGGLGERSGSKIAVADDAGRFLFADLPRGQYRFTAQAFGYVPTSKSVLLRDQRQRLDFTLLPGGLTLQGHVKDSGVGPIAGARVYVRIGAPWSIVQDFANVAVAIADADGRYRVSVPPGYHGISAHGDGYVPQTAAVHMADHETHDFHLLPAATLSGRVVEKINGRPVQGALVRLEGPFSPGEQPTVNSGLDGTFEFSKLEPGTYYVNASKDDIGGRTSNPATVTLTSIVTGVVVELESGLTLVGRVQSSDGSAIADADIVISSDGSGATVRARGRTSDQGIFRMSGLQGGAVVISATAAGYAALAREITVTETSPSVSLILRQLARLSGRVQDSSGNPATDALVNAVLTARGANAPILPVKTRLDGAFSFDEMPPGIARLYVEHPSLGQMASAPIDLRPGESQLVNLRFTAGPRVSGRVLWADGSAAPGMRVRAESPRSTVSVLTNNEGAFSVGPFAPQVSVALSVDVAMPGEQSQATRLLELGSASISNVEFRIERPVGTISGRVVDREGHGFQGALLWTHPRSPQGRILAGTDGSFSIDGLFDGQYDLSAESPGSTAVEIRAVPTGTRNLRIVLEESGAIAGTVRNAQHGTAVPLFSVAVLNRERSSHQGSPRPTWARHGTFESRGLAPGIYDLHVSTPDGLSGKATAIPVRSGQRTENVQVTVDAGARATGRVVRMRDLSPIQNTRVLAEVAGRSIETWSDDKGDFGLTGLLRDVPVSLSFTAAGFRSRQIAIVARSASESLGDVTLSEAKDENTGRIGLTFNISEAGQVIVDDVARGMPASAGGLLAGDVVTHVDGRELRGFSAGQISDLLKGPAGTSVSLQVNRNGSPRTFQIPRI